MQFWIEIGLRVEKLRSAIKKREIDMSLPVPEIRFDQSEQSQHTIK